MKKLKLDVESLSVESFDAAPEAEERHGTVAAHEVVTTNCPTYPVEYCLWSFFPTCGIYC